jgi:hypothetical protein
VWSLDSWHNPRVTLEFIGSEKPTPPTWLLSRLENQHFATILHGVTHYLPTHSEFRQACAEEQAPGGQNRPYLPILQGKHLLNKPNRANLRIFVLKNGPLGGHLQFFQASSQEASLRIFGLKNGPLVLNSNSSKQGVIRQASLTWWTL